jgi:hypothetical protein
MTTLPIPSNGRGEPKPPRKWDSASLDKAAAMARATTDDRFIAQYMGMTEAEVRAVRRDEKRNRREFIPTTRQTKPVVGMMETGLAETVTRRISAEQGSAALLEARPACSAKSNPASARSKRRSRRVSAVICTRCCLPAASAT